MYTPIAADIMDKKFIGADELRRNLTKILQKLNGDRIVITQHGKPRAILLDIATYLGLTDIQEDIQPGYIGTLYKELEQVKKGKGISHEELVKSLEL